jgi:hypothetical protein
MDGIADDGGEGHVDTGEHMFAFGSDGGERRANDETREAVRRLRRCATDEQRQLAAAHGVRIGVRTPYMVAGPLLREGLGEALGTERTPAAEGRLSYLADLATDAAIDLPAVETSGQAQAWIEHLLTQRTLSGLLEL